nr:hypothetical protein [Tanacetum cinerariifolium]
MGATREEFMNFLSASLTDRITEQVRKQLPQILLEEVSNFAPPVIKKIIEESLNQVNLAKVSSQPQSTYEAAATLTKFELNKILIDKMNISESYLIALGHRECYDGLTKSYNLDKDFFSSYDVYSLKRSRKGKDKDEGPFARSARGFNKRNTRKDAELTTGSKSKDSTSGSSKGKKSHPKYFGKNVQSEVLEFEVTDTDLPQDHGGNLGNDDDEPRKESASNVTGPAFILIKCTRSNYAELEYDFKECYKALLEKLDWENPDGDDFLFDLTKPLPLVKTKATHYDLPGIEDMVPNIWSPVKVALDRYAKWVPAKEKMKFLGKEKSSLHDQGNQQAAEGKKDYVELGKLYKMAGENVPALTISDDQILSFAAWVPIGKCNFVLDLHKKQKNLIFQISMDILQNTNFFRAFTASASLGYTKVIHFVSRMAMNNLYQPWRAILSMINHCLAGKTSGHNRPRYLVLEMLWGIITSNNVDNAELLWEEFVQAIQTFLTDKANLDSPTKKGGKDKPHVIPYCWFTKLIIFHLGRFHNIHQRSTSPFHLAEEDLRLGNLISVPKGEVNKVFGMPIPNELISNNIRNAPYYNAYLEMVTKHDQKVVAEKEGKKKTASAKQPKSKPAIEKSSKPTPTPNPKAAKERPSKVFTTKSPKPKPAKEKSTKTTPPQQAGKGAASEKTNSGGDTEILQIDEEQGKDVDEQVFIDEDQARPDPGESRGALAELDPKPTHDEFMADLYLKVQERLKFLADEHVILEDPISSTMTLFSMKNLEDAYAIGYQFINDKSTKDEPKKPNVEAKVVSMVTVPIYQASSSIPPLVFNLELKDLPHNIDEAIRESMREARMFETGTYKSLLEHVLLYEALEAPSSPPPDSDLSKKRQHDTGASGSSQLQSPQSSAWKKSNTRDAPPSFSKQQSDPHVEQPVEDIQMPDTANISNSEDTDYAHLSKIKDMRTFMHCYCQQIGKTELTQADFKGQSYEVVKGFYTDVVHLQFQMEECHKMLTYQIDWANPESDQVRIDINKPLPLSGPPGHVTIQTKFFFNHNLDYLRYSSKESGEALSIFKMKAACNLNFGLEILVPEHMWINKVCTYDISASYGISHWWFNRPKFYIDRYIAGSSCKRVKDFQLGIESYQKQLNLTKPGWDGKGFEYKHDYIIIDSPRVVVFPVGNDERKITRFNEIYKFIHGAKNLYMPLNEDSRPERSFETQNALLVVEYEILTTYSFIEPNEHIISEFRQADNKSKFDNNPRDNHDQQSPFKRQNMARAHITRPGEKKEYVGTLPLCNKCNYHHNWLCAARSTNYKSIGHLTRDYRNPVAANNQRTLTCYECGNQGHYKSDCPELMNQNHGNQARSSEARGRVYALRGRETD